MNWTGLLNWSLSYCDGPGQSRFSEMDQETKNWLKEALESMCLDETKILKKATEVLGMHEEGREEEKLMKEEILNQLTDIIENLETARNLVKMGGMGSLVRCMVGSSFYQVKKMAATVFQSGVQNNPYVQKAAFEENAIEALTAAINHTEDLKLKELYVGCLSGLLRGEYSEARQNFVSTDGLIFIDSILCSPPSNRALKKCLLMLSDFFFWGKTEHNIIYRSQNVGLLDSLQRLLAHSDQEVKELSQSAISNYQEAITHIENVPAVKG